MKGILFLALVIAVVGCERDCNGSNVKVYTSGLRALENNGIDEMYVDECEGVGDGSSLDWAICTREKADSLQSILSSIYNDRIEYCEEKLRSDDSGSDYFSELVNATREAQFAFDCYLNCERILEGALIGFATARSASENLREIELIEERIRYLQSLDFTH